MQTFDIAVLVGSLRQESFSRKLAKSLATLAPQTLRLRMVEIGDLPLYNEDLERAPPTEFTRFRSEIAAATAVLFVTPEYNRGIPGALKNAVDVGSRPWGKSVWNGKPAAVISISPGALGGFGANHQLRQVLAAVNAVTMPHPEAYIGGAASLFDEAGELTHAGTRDFLAGFLRAFELWIKRQVAPQG